LQLIADAIGLGEVLCLSGCLALGNERFDLVVILAAASGGSRWVDRSMS